MMNSKNRLIWSGIAIAIAAPLIAAGYLHVQRDSFSCEVYTTIIQGDATIELIMNYDFRQGKGHYQSSGEYSSPGKPTIRLSNKVEFDYWYEDGRVIMISSETNELPRKDFPFRNVIPDFYHLRERGVSFQVVPANDSSYYFLYAGSPVFYCIRD